MKKKWLNFIFASALMLTGATSFVLPTEDLSFEKETQSVVSTYEEPNLESEQTPINPVDPPTVDPVDPQEPSDDPVEPEQEPFDDSVFETAVWSDYASFGFAGGDGSSENPYQISCAEDFAYWSNEMFNNYLFYVNKNFVLTNDIIFNDGYFEEDGTYHDGGDGVLYSWTPMPPATRITLDGQGNTIYGMYVDIIDTNGAGLFSNSGLVIKEFKNINVENAYLSANKHSYALGMYVDKITKCTIENSTIKATSVASSFAYSVLSEVSNCVSYANIYCDERGGGIVSGLGNKGLLKDSKFAGRIISTGDLVGGMIVYSDSTNITLDSCEMAGYVEGKGKSIGGFVGQASYGSLNILNCVNRGEIVAKNDTTKYSGGTFIGVCRNGNYMLQNCENYGRAYGVDSNGNLIGSGGFIYLTQVTSAGTIVTDTNINIISCKNYSYDTSFIRDAYLTVQTAIKVNINISNCITTLNGSKVEGAIVYSIYGRGVLDKVNIQNLIVNVESSVSSFSLINLCTAGNITIRNVIINLRKQKTELKQFILPTAIPSRVDVKSVLINQTVNDTTKNYYYGYNFKDYFSDWRTAKIGLKTMQAVGSFFATVDEDVLKNLGYTKLG